MIDVSKLKKFDIVEYLNTEEDIRAFLNDALETGDPKYIAHAFGQVIRAKGVTEFAKKAGLRREVVYQATSEQGNPTLATLIAIITALGFNMNLTPAHHQIV